MKKKVNKENRITIRLDNRLLNKIVRIMKKLGYSDKSKCIRKLIEIGLENI